MLELQDIKRQDIKKIDSFTHIRYQIFGGQTTLFRHGFDSEPHLQSGPYVTPSVLQGQPRFVFLARFVEKVLLHEQKTRFGCKRKHTQ